MDQKTLKSYEMIVGSGTILKDKYFIPFILLILSDLFVFTISFIIAYIIRFYTSIYVWFPPPEPPYVPEFAFYLQLSTAISLLGIFVYYHFGFYDRRIGLDRNIRPASFIVATSVIYIFIMALLFNYRDFEFSRLTVGLAIPITCINIILVNDILKKMHSFLVKKGILFFKTILVGPEWQCREVYQKLQEHHGSQYQIIGFVTTERGTTIIDPALPCLGYRSRLAKIIEKESADNVIIAMPPSDHNTILQVMNVCTRKNTQFRVVPELFDELCLKLTIEELKALPTVAFGETPLFFFNAGWFLKRSMDVVVSALALIVASPLMLIIALMIRLDSKGSIFFVQERVGNNGRTFNMYKFRSMVDEAEKGTGPRWATLKDPRTTKIGKFLRMYNLDELPQFINVLRGDMSLVGPRPERPYFVNKFKEEIPFYMRRHLVKAGLTGWAQVNGWRGDTSVMERTRHDLYYVENWSLLLDLKIMLKTITSFKNAY